MGPGGTSLRSFALSNKATEHLMFSEPSGESAMCIANAFRASLRHFSLLTELKAQFNHNGVISESGSLRDRRHSSIASNRFMASNDTRLLYSSSRLIFVSLVYSTGSFIMSNTLLETPIDTR